MQWKETDPFRGASVMDLSSSLPPQGPATPGDVPESYLNALSTLQDAKGLLLTAADEREGLRQLRENNAQLVEALEENINIQHLNDIQLMRQFYDDVTTGSAKVDARIRAIESVQWLDLDDKYGIRRHNLLGESRNMRAIEEKAMRANAMAALRHYLGEFQVKKIKSQLESADAWFGAQEKRLKEEVLMLNPDGSQTAAQAQKMEIIEAALLHENVDANLSSAFSQRGQNLADASARIYQSFAIWAGRAKRQLEETKLESAAAAKHLKNRLLSTEAETSYLRARAAELEVSVALSGADEASIKADIQAKYLPTQKSLQEQIFQLRGQIADVQDSINQDKEEIESSKRMAISLKNYNPDEPEDGDSTSIKDRQSIFKEYLKQLTMKDSLANERLQKQIDHRFEALRALGTAEAEAKDRVAAAQAKSRASAIALDKHKIKAAGDRNALEIMLKALSGKKESLDKKISRAEERAAVKMRSAQIRDKNSAVLKALSDNNKKIAGGHRSTAVATAPATAAPRAHRMTSHTPQTAAGRYNTAHSGKNSLQSTRKKSLGSFRQEDRKDDHCDSSAPRKGSISRSLRKGSLTRRPSIDGERSLLSSSSRKNSLKADVGTVSGNSEVRSDVSVSVPLSARKTSFLMHDSKDEKIASPDASPLRSEPHPPSVDRDAKLVGRPPRVVRANNKASTDAPLVTDINRRTPCLSEQTVSETGPDEPAGGLHGPSTLVSEMGATDENVSAEEVVEPDELVEPCQLCGKSNSTLLAAMYSFFIIDQRLVRLEKNPVGVMDAPSEPVLEQPYISKFGHIKPALPKDIYYKNKRRAAPIKRRMFSSDNMEEEELVEHPLVKYLVIDEHYSMTFEFSEALIAVNRSMTLLMGLGYLGEPASTNSALCNMFNYFNANFLLDDFKPAPIAISRPVYPFAVEISPKLWRRYQEALQAIRYQDHFQREDELRRFCMTVVKYCIDTFVQVAETEQKYFKANYSLTIQETDVNIWLRMAEVLPPILGTLAVVVNSTFEASFQESQEASGDDGDEPTAMPVVQVVPPPPTECGLGRHMSVFLNHACEHVHGAVCLANGKRGKVEAALFIPMKVHSPGPAPTDFSVADHIVDSSKTYKVHGETTYPLSFTHSSGFFFTLYRAAFMTSMVDTNTHNPYFGLLREWLLTYFPNNWKDDGIWKAFASRVELKMLLLRDIQLLRAFSGYFYYTGLGEQLVDLETAVKRYKSELAVLAAHSDIFGEFGPSIGASAMEDGAAMHSVGLESPGKATRFSVVTLRGGINCHDVSFLNLVSSIVPSALPVITVLRMILKLAFRQIKILGVTTIDTDTAKEECSRMASIRKAMTAEARDNFCELEETVCEKAIPMAQKVSYQQLEGLAKDLLDLISVQVDAYENKLRDHTRMLERLDSVMEEEAALGIERPELSPPSIDPATAASITNTVNGEPFLRHGNRMTLELPYDIIKRLESLLTELKDLSHAIAKGTKTLSTLTTLRFQSLLDELTQVMVGIKMQRRKVEAWLSQQKQTAELQALVASNRRSLIGICEAMLDACGVSMEGAMVQQQLDQCDVGCERIRSARRKLKFLDSVESNAGTDSTAESQQGNETGDTIIRTKLEAIKESTSILRTHANPKIRERLLQSGTGEEMEQFQHYLMEQMSMVLVQTSHWKSEWDEIVQSRHPSSSRSSQQLSSRDRQATNENCVAEQADIRLSDLLGVATTPTINLTPESEFAHGGIKTEEGTAESGGKVLERNVVAGTQWRLTRGVLRPGEDVLAGSVG